MGVERRLCQVVVANLAESASSGVLQRSTAVSSGLQM
jgi:hypothetical protein